MYENSLILRLTMTEKPFAYKEAYSNLETNFMFHDEVVNILPKIIKQKGVINIGGKSQSVYSFAKYHNKKVKKIKMNKKTKLPPKQTMNISKLKRLLSK